eukprot:scaffold71_cov247-Pinguiococcus_pyrenoidosus.AAC.38
MAHCARGPVSRAFARSNTRHEPRAERAAEFLACSQRGGVPCEVRLHAGDVASVTGPEPIFLMLKRNSYLPVALKPALEVLRRSGALLSDSRDAERNSLPGFRGVCVGNAGGGVRAVV